MHLSIFLEVCDTLKINGASIDAICLHLSPFSLKGKARARLHSLPLGSITTWDDLAKVFLTKFFLPSKMASLRNQIASFTQQEDEYIKQLAPKVDVLTTHNKMLEAQIAQQASSSPTPFVHFLANPNLTLMNNAMP